MSGEKRGAVLQRLEQSLRDTTLRVVGVIELPLGLGCVSGIPECAVVKEDAPYYFQSVFYGTFAWTRFDHRLELWC